MSYSSYADIVRECGPQAVVSLTATAEEVAEMTAQQAKRIDKLVRPLLDDDRQAIDYGCGCGRLTPLVASWTGFAVGYDSEPSMFRHAPMPTSDASSWAYTNRVSGRFGLVFAWLVLGNPWVNCEEMASEIARLSEPGGLVIIGEHCAVTQPEGRFWRFRSVLEYCHFFRGLGVDLRRIGRVDQFDNPVTVLAGRKVGN